MLCLPLDWWAITCSKLCFHTILSLVFYSTMFTFFSLLLVQFHGDIIHRSRSPQQRNGTMDSGRIESRDAAEISSIPVF